LRYLFRINRNISSALTPREAHIASEGQLYCPLASTVQGIHFARSFATRMTTSLPSAQPLSTFNFQLKNRGASLLPSPHCARGGGERSESEGLLQCLATPKLRQLVI
jgi:hypothetical protein